MKTAEELNALKNEVETMNKKLAELTEDELKSVTGGLSPAGCSALSKKLEEMYRKDKLTREEFLEIYEIVYSGNDFLIDSWLYRRTKSGSEWNDVYLYYRSLT